MAIHIHDRRIRSTRLVLLIIGVLFGLYLWKHLPSDSSKEVSSEVNDIGDFVQFTKDKDNYKDDIRYGNEKVNRKEIGEVTEAFLKKMDKKTHKCPDYVDYSQAKHPPFSGGKHNYPFMRPAPKCRTFVSEAVEEVINDLKSKVENEDLARLIENCLPNTLDTTILWHTDSLKESKEDVPQSFVVTGDIHAEWLRDAARQLSVYQPFIKYDNRLKQLMKGAINTQAYYIMNSPYCNAFHPPPGSGVKRGDTAVDQVYPRPDWRQVFECKYELDSLASFLTLSNEYYENSGGDLSFFNDLWLKAYERILIVMKRESQPSFDEGTGQALPFYYSFQRQTNIGSETLPLGGVGNPVNYASGLVRSAFRPSDDACILQFFIPANSHMLTELKRAKKNFLKTENQPDLDIEVLLHHTDTFIEDISRGIAKYGIVEHPDWGRVYAYEVDGYGSSIYMDDANIPSLLSLPDMGFVDVNDEVYQNTRKMILSKVGNPYFLTGSQFEGIGGPHIGIHYAWPMSLLVRIRTTDDEEEIMKSLNLIMDSTADLGLMHESVHVNSRKGMDYTRTWFAWCNSEFGKTILYLAKNKPHLIFKKEFARAYNLDEVLSKMID